MTREEAVKVLIDIDNKAFKLFSSGETYFEEGTGGALQMAISAMSAKCHNCRHSDMSGLVGRVYCMEHGVKFGVDEYCSRYEKDEDEQSDTN